MITLGAVLLILGLIAKVPILTTLGFAILVIGLILLAFGLVGREIGGRRHYY
jgi:hypothetical protein